MTAFTASDVAFPGGTVRSWTLGPADAPAVVVTPGGALDHRGFRPLAERLAASGRRVVLWDLPGHGESLPLPRGFGLPLCADALAAVLARHGIARATHLGFSFGGMTAQVFARRNPQAVSHLIAYGCFTPHLVKPPVARAAAGPLVRAMWGLKPWPQVKAAFAQACSATAHGRADAERAMEAGGRVTFLAMATALLRDWDYVPAFRLPCRVDVVSGALDSNGERLRASLAAIRRAYPDGDEAVIEGAGHAAHLDRPYAFETAVLAFLAAAPLFLPCEAGEVSRLRKEP